MLCGNHRRASYAAVVAISLLLSVGAARADVRRIGIAVSVKVNVTDEEARTLAGELAGVIRQALPVDVLAGKEVERRIPPAGVPANCLNDSTCRQDLGRRLDAEELLVLVIVKAGGKLQIDSMWANVASGKVVSRPAITVAAGDDRARVFRESVPLLLPHIRREKSGPNIVIVPTPVGGTTTTDTRRFTAGTWIATGVAVAGLITGSVFALSAQSKHNALVDEDCRNVACAPGRISTMERHALLADLSFGVAIAGAVTAVALYTLSGSKRTVEAAPTKPVVSVGASASSLSLIVGGSF